MPTDAAAFAPLGRPCLLPALRARGLSRRVPQARATAAAPRVQHKQHQEPQQRPVYADFVRIEGDEHDPLRRRDFGVSVRNFARRAMECFGIGKIGKAAALAAAQSGGRRHSGAQDWVRFLKVCLFERKYLTMSSLALIGAAFCEVAVPHYSSKALNSVVVTGNMEDFRHAVKTVVALGLGSSAFTFVRAAFFGLAGTRIATRARSMLLGSLLTQEMAFFDSKDTGELTNRLSADCSKFSSVVSSHVNVLLRQTIQLVGGSIFLFRINRGLALVTVIGIFLIGALTTLHGEFIRRMGRRSQDSLAKANAVAGQILSLVRVVRSHGSEQRELQRYGAELRNTVNMLETHDLGHSVYRSLVRLLQTGLQASVMALGALAVMQKQMTGEQLTSFLFYVNFVSAASFDVGDRWTSIQDAIGSTTSVFALMDRKPRLRVREDLRAAAPQEASAPAAVQYDYSDSGSHATPQSSLGRVNFVDVTFAYPLRDKTTVLSDINLEIRPGERTAIVGGSGAGKSTLMRLLTRFYDASEGAVLLDGQDIRSLTQRELTQRICFLPQEPQLLPISIADNIVYGMPEGSYSMEDIEQAAKEANVHSFIQSLPDRYQTRVGEGSVSLSGGEKQRVCLARAIIRRPNVLLLDEPTSALDVTSEKVVQEALDLVSTGRTVVIIAHRLSTIKDVENIVVMENGRVAEQGDHAVLKAADGLYAHLLKTYKDSIIDV